MYKFTSTVYMLNGASDPFRTSGEETTVCFSKSPKKACSLEGTVVYRFHGHDSTPIMVRRKLELGAKVLFDIWS